MGVSVAQLEIPRQVGRYDTVVSDRYEYKYTISPSLVGPIRSFIRPYCEMDPFADREPDGFYTITSLYLDSSGYKTYWDKEHDVPSRFKLRVRTYGDGCDAPVQFEIKRFLNEITRKTCVQVPSEIWPMLLSGPTQSLALSLGRPERQALDDFIRLTRTYGARPTMLVRYERQAFTGRMNDSVRISFDRRLRYQPARAYDLTGGPAIWRSGDLVASMGRSEPGIVFELKFASAIPPWLVDLVRTFGLMRRGFSKYCSAVKRTLSAGHVASELACAIPATRLMRMPCLTC